MINSYPVRFERPRVDEEGAVRMVADTDARLEIALKAHTSARGAERKPAMIELTIRADDGRYALSAAAPVAHAAAGDLCAILAALMPQHVQQAKEEAS